MEAAPPSPPPQLSGGSGILASAPLLARALSQLLLGREGEGAAAAAARSAEGARLPAMLWRRHHRLSAAAAAPRLQRAQHPHAAAQPSLKRRQPDRQPRRVQSELRPSPGVQSSAARGGRAREVRLRAAFISTPTCKHPPGERTQWRLRERGGRPGEKMPFRCLPSANGLGLVRGSGDVLRKCSRMEAGLFSSAGGLRLCRSSPKGFGDTPPLGMVPSRQMQADTRRRSHCKDAPRWLRERRAIWFPQRWPQVES